MGPGLVHWSMHRFCLGRLTSLYEIPDETNITVDVLDANDNIIDGHQNLSLPFDLE